MKPSWRNHLAEWAGYVLFVVMLLGLLVLLQLTGYLAGVR